MFGLMLTAATLLGATESEAGEIICEGQYKLHLQGVAGNGVDRIYWSFTDVLVKTDAAGTVLAKVDVPRHHGDLCLAGDKLYVAWSNKFNSPGADSKIYVYNAEDLSLLEIVPVKEVIFGAGGVEHLDGHFYVIGGLPPGYEENTVYEYDSEWKYVTSHTLPSGYTNLGIQTVCFHDGFFWFGCYTVAKKKGLIRTDRDFNIVGIYDISPSIGLIGWGEGRFLMAKHFGEKYQAKLVPVAADEETGLAPVRTP